jgi:hypothetical protein
MINTTNNAQPQPPTNDKKQHWIDHQYNQQRLTTTNNQQLLIDDRYNQQRSTTINNRQQTRTLNWSSTLPTIQTKNSQATTTIDGWSIQPTMLNHNHQRTTKNSIRLIIKTTNNAQRTTMACSLWFVKESSIFYLTFSYYKNLF